MRYKLKKIGYYIKPNRESPAKGVVYDRITIAPCLCDYSGGGGNLTPTILLAYEMENDGQHCGDPE